jgi:hypothetical protein
MIRTKQSILTTVLFAIGALAGAVASGAEVNVTLSGANEVPPVTTSASGKGTITIANDGAVSGSVTASGVAATMAHIHMGAEGKNGRPIITLQKKGDTYEVPAGAKLSAEQMQAFKAGDLYINVHSDAHPSGEIRGQLK